MSRPRYETQEDLDNERAVARFLEDRWTCKFIKLNPIKWKVDFLVRSLKDLDKYSWAEVKCLNMNFGDFPFMISYKKIEAAKALHETSGHKFMLIFRCLDKLCYHAWDFSKQYKFEYSGRTVATRDGQDVEPIFRVYPEECKIVEGFNA